MKKINGIGIIILLFNSYFANSQQQTIEHSAFPVLKVTRTTSSTGGGLNTFDGIRSGLYINTLSSNNMENGFGGGIIFGANDNTLTSNNYLARIYARRYGADNLGLLQFCTGNGGTQINMTIREDGNVGIGTTSPITGLQVMRSSNIGGKWNPSGGIFMTSEGSNSLIMDTNEVYGTGTLYLGSKSGDIIRFRTVTDTGSNDKVVIKSDGRMGIGTVSPQGNLHISADNSGDAILRLEADSDNNNESDNPLIQLRQDGGALGVNIGYSEENFGSNIFGIGTRYSNQESWDVFTINTSNGHVGIGTTTTGSHKLAVDGSIGAREIKVEVGTWSDFVFYKDYKLPTLKEVEKHIKEKGHLQNIPSEKDVEENGILLGEMNAKLLQKIEELTLYTIQQEKKLKSQDLKINKLEKENQQLKSLSDRLTEIEKLLKTNRHEN